MEEYSSSSSSCYSNHSSSCRRSHWRPAEDEKLMQLVHQYGPANWNSISDKLNGRSGKSCRLRWFNQLDPRINRRPFTEREEERLMAAHRAHGNKWALISRLFPGRTDNAVKNHWHVITARSRRERSERREPLLRRISGGTGTSSQLHCHLNRAIYGNYNHSNNENNNNDASRGYLWGWARVVPSRPFGYLKLGVRDEDGEGDGENNMKKVLGDVDDHRGELLSFSKDDQIHEMEEQRDSVEDRENDETGRTLVYKEEEEEDAPSFIDFLGVGI